MFVKNQMTKDPLCVSVDTKISEVVDIMTEKGLHRLPVVEGRKLIGLVTKGMISEKGASKATSLSIFELNYLLSKTTVKAIMEKNVITIEEDALLEDAALAMLKHDIGCLPVINKAHEVVGILTQNDLFKAFIDLLGYQERGARITIEVIDKLGAIEEISRVFVRNEANITHVGVYRKENNLCDIVFRIDTLETDALEKDLNASGYPVVSIIKNPVV